MNEHMACKDVETDLALFVGGELDPQAASAVHVHVESCSSCEAEVGRLRVARQALREGYDRSQAQVPDLWPALRTRLSAEGALRTQTAPAAEQASRAAARRRPQWLPLSAAAAALFAFGLWLGQRAGDDVHVPAPIASANTQPIQATSVGLRRLAPGESALSDGATTSEELRDEARRLGLPNQPGAVQTASQRHRYEH